MSVGEIILVTTDLAVAALIAAWFIGLYFGIKGLVKPEKRTVDYLVEYEIEDKGLDRAVTEIPFEQLFRTSRFGYELAARFYECEGSSKTVVCLHGHNSCFASQLKYLPIFLSLGYSVFIPDHRRSGLSGGDTVTFGAYEKHDVLDWISELRARRPEDSVALFGESMGAATAIMVAAEIPDAVFLIDYCGYANFEGLLTRYTDNEGIRKAVMPSIRLIAEHCFGFEVKECDALEAIKRVSCPILIMHSKADKTVNYKNALMLKEAAPQAELHTFPDSIHARSITKYPDEYANTVKEFVRKAETAYARRGNDA